jgi:hypothetical protein
MSRVVQLAGAALLVGTGLLALLAGPAAATGPPASSEVPDSAVPIGSVTPGPFSSGQVISVLIPANSVFTPEAGIFIEECAAPGGAAPTDPSQCDGETVQGDTILAGSDGSVDYTAVTNKTSGYTIYALPDLTTLGESPSGVPVCNLTNECVLYIGQNQNDFTQPHFFSQAFYVTPTPGDTGADPGDGTAPASGPTVDPTTSTVTAAAVAPSPVANGLDPATVTVRLLDSTSDAVPGKTVTLSAESGSSVITPSSGALSGADGTAVFTVTDATAQAVTYSATDTSDTPVIPITQTATVTFTAPAVAAAHSTVAASPTQVAADGTTASTITVTLRDQGTVSEPVAGKAVTLSPSGGSSTVTTVSGTTNSVGVATFSVVDSTNETVTYSATGGGVPLTQTAAVTFGTVAVSPGTSTVVAAQSTAGVGGTQGTSITVTLLTSGDSPVNGKTVSLASTSATANISAATSTTGNGEATFTVTDSVAESVTFTATDTSDSPVVPITQTAKVTFTAPSASASLSTISASPTTVPADGSTASVITVTIRDQFGNPLAGKAVTLQLTDASGYAEAPPQAGTGGSQNPGTTNASGQAVFSLVDTSAEVVTVAAVDTTDSNLSLTSTVSVTFTAGLPDPTQSQVSASPTSVPSDGTTTATITVTLEDHQTNPVAGKAITLTPSGGSSVVTPKTATTGSNGVATFSVTDTAAEAVTYSASDTTDDPPVDITQTATVAFGSPPPAIADSVLAGSATSAPANGSTAVTITALLYDANGDPVVGKTVSLDAQGGSSTVTTVLGVTNPSGQATFTVTDDTVETVTYTATDTSDNLPISGQSVVVAFTTPTGAAATATTTTTTAPGGSTTTTVASSPSQAGSGGAQAATAADTGAVGASSGQLALTGTPSLLPWLFGFGLVLLFGGSLGRRLLRTGT